MESTSSSPACCAPCTRVCSSGRDLNLELRVDFCLATGDDDALEPLRGRYDNQHYRLLKFYYECSNLRYLTSLITVPKLPQEPPNLLAEDEDKPALPRRPVRELEPRRNSLHPHPLHQWPRRIQNRSTSSGRTSSEDSRKSMMRSNEGYKSNGINSNTSSNWHNSSLNVTSKSKGGNRQSNRDWRRNN